MMLGFYFSTLTIIITAVANLITFLLLLQRLKSVICQLSILFEPYRSWSWVFTLDNHLTVLTQVLKSKNLISDFITTKFRNACERGNRSIMVMASVSLNLLIALMCPFIYPEVSYITILRTWWWYYTKSHSKHFALLSRAVQAPSRQQICFISGLLDWF